MDSVSTQVRRAYQYQPSDGQAKQNGTANQQLPHGQGAANVLVGKTNADSTLADDAIHADNSSDGWSDSASVSPVAGTGVIAARTKPAALPTRAEHRVPQHSVAKEAVSESTTAAARPPRNPTRPPPAAARAAGVAATAMTQGYASAMVASSELAASMRAHHEAAVALAEREREVESLKELGVCSIAMRI